MQAYKTIVTVQAKQRLILENIPFPIGQEVEVVVLAAEPSPSDKVARLKALFAQTQALPQVQAISEEDIAAEIAAYRNSS